MRKLIVCALNDLKGITDVQALNREFELGFVPNSEAALTALAQPGAEAIVTDLPSDPNSELSLFNRTKNRFPKISRLMLMDATNRTAMRSDGLVHQFLSKPCSAGVLVAAVERARLVTDWLLDPAVKNLFGRMRKLPSVPSVYVRLMKKLQMPEASIDDIGEIVGEDLNLTAKVLQMVNSAAFGLNRTVATPQDAVGYLGMERTKGLVLVASAFAQADNPKPGGLSVDELWRHSLATARFARTIAKDHAGRLAEEAFTAGLLHDVGKLLFAVNIGDEYNEAQKKAQERRVSIDEIEKETFGATHAQVGACVLGIWGLPPNILQAIAFHHCPESLSEAGFNILTAVHVANALAHRSAAADDKPSFSVLDTQYLRAVGVQPQLDALSVKYAQAA